jgi:hypothetical protein
LGQHYIIDQVSRAIDYRAIWHRHNESTVFGGIKNVSNNIADMCGEDISNNTIIFDDPEFLANSSNDVIREIPASLLRHRYKLKSEP